MKNFTVALVVASLLPCICLDRYLTWNSLEEIKDVHEANIREMLRIAIVSVSQKGAVEAMAITKQLGDELELMRKMNFQLASQLCEAYKELESLKQSNRDLLEMFNKPDRET